MLFRIILVFMLLLPYYTQGQDQQLIDSLEIRLTEDLADSTRVKMLITLGWVIKENNPDSAATILQEALSIAEENDLVLSQARSLNILGIIYRMHSEYERALKAYFRTLDILEELGNEIGIAVTLGNIGTVYLGQGNYAKALEMMFRSLKKKEELVQMKGVAAELGNIGTVYGYLNQYDEALEYHFKSLEISEEMSLSSDRATARDSKRSAAATIGNIGVIYSKKAQYAKAQVYAQRALALNEELELKSSIISDLGNLGTIFRKQADSAMASSYAKASVDKEASALGRHIAMTDLYPKAIDFNNRATQLCVELGDKHDLSLNMANLGLIYTHMGKFKEAETELLDALRIAKEIGAMESSNFQYLSLSQLYDTIGKPGLAFEAYKMHIIFRDSISNEENTKAQTRAEMRYEYEKAELVEEQNEQEVARLLAEKTDRRDNLQYSVVLICLLVIGVVVAMLGRLALPERVAEGLIFFAFLILFEFVLVLADPYVDIWTGGAPGWKLLINAGIAAMIFPLHAFFEKVLKKRLVE